MPGESELGRCAECGKLMQLGAGRRRCAACDEAAQPPPPAAPARPVVEMEPIAAPRGGPWKISTTRPPSGAPPEPISWKDVYDVLLQAPRLDAARACVRCKIRPKLENSEFCLTCNVDLTHDFGDAAQDLFGRMDVVEEPPPSLNVSSALEEKRARTATSRINPVGMRRLKR